MTQRLRRATTVLLPPAALLSWCAEQLHSFSERLRLCEMTTSQPSALPLRLHAAYPCPWDAMLASACEHVQAPARKTSERPLPPCAGHQSWRRWLACRHPVDGLPLAPLMNNLLQGLLVQASVKACWNVCTAEFPPRQAQHQSRDCTHESDWMAFEWIAPRTVAEAATQLGARPPHQPCACHPGSLPAAQVMRLLLVAAELWPRRRLRDSTSTHHYRNDCLGAPTPHCRCRCPRAHAAPPTKRASGWSYARAALPQRQAGGAQRLALGCRPLSPCERLEGCRCWPLGISNGRLPLHCALTRGLQRRRLSSLPTLPGQPLLPWLLGPSPRGRCRETVRAWPAQGPAARAPVRQLLGPASISASVMTGAGACWPACGRTAAWAAALWARLG
eukprot:363901-Chlamydomonas_euryale.AAC.2